MSFLGPRELVEVALLRPDTRAKLDALMHNFEARTGEKTFVPKDGGYRTAGRQDAIYADSLKAQFRAAPSRSGMHVRGAAFDLHIVDHTTGDAAKDAANPLYKILAEEAEKLGLRAGLHFHTGLADPYHFEENETLAIADDKWAAVVRGRL